MAEGQGAKVGKVQLRLAMRQRDSQTEFTSPHGDPRPMPAWYTVNYTSSSEPSSQQGEKLLQPAGRPNGLPSNAASGCSKRPEKRLQGNAEDHRRRAPGTPVSAAVWRSPRPHHPRSPALISGAEIGIAAFIHSAAWSAFVCFSDTHQF